MRTRRVRVSLEKSGDGSASSPQASLDGVSLILDTESIRYKWRGIDGSFHDYEKLIPTEFNASQL
jgi:DNA polymerase-3 subunit beta